MDPTVKNLSKWCQDEPGIPEVNEKLLKTFLHTCDNNEEETKRTITSYFKLRRSMPELFSNRDPTDGRLLIASEIFYSILLPNTTTEGYRVIAIGYFTNDTSKYNYVDVMKLFLMTIDMWISQLELCSGYLLLIDCSNSSSGHFTPIPFRTLKNMSSYFVKGFPVRLEGLLLLNVSSAVNMLLSLLKFILPRRVTNKIHMFTSGSKDLLDFIPLSMLPSDMGGQHASVERLHEKTLSCLRECKEYFKEEDITYSTTLK